MERQTGLILSQVETWVAELERAVQSFEGAVMHAEQRMDEVEQQGPDSDSGLQLLLTHALDSSHAAEERVSIANAALSDALVQAEVTLRSRRPGDELAPLQGGTLVCAGRYRLVQLLHSRPRVHLYLARRVDGSGEQPLFAIRELVLNGLSLDLRRCIERAAFEEFAAPQLFGMPHLPGVGDRGYLENERHYLVMQPRQVRGSIAAFAAPLSELLQQHTRGRGHAWLDIATILSWGIRLCHTVAHLHAQQNILGEITPQMLLVDREGSAPWAPILLASWPPAPRFWPGPGEGEEYHQVFPAKDDNTLAANIVHVFAAPEIYEGLRDERSDVYALGAILYLLLTGRPPTAAEQRLQGEVQPWPVQGEHPTPRVGRKTERPRQAAEQEQALTPPQVLNQRISPLLEQILLRALALNPEQRFANAQDLAEALASIHLKAEATGTAAPPHSASRLRRLLEWIKK